MINGDSQIANINDNVNKPLISIVTVCFNSAKTIRRTIESVLNQTYNNIEYIIIDGKSTDNTLDIIKEYEAKFAEKGIVYRYISEPDSGIYDAMNKGIKMATGEWINIQGSDDWLLSGASQEFSDFAIDSDTMIVGGICIVCDCLDGKVVPLMYRQINLDIAMKYHMSICHQGAFIRKVYHDMHLYDTSFKILADFDMFMSMKISNVKMQLLPSIIGYYNNGGLSSIDSLEIKIEKLKILKRYNLVKRIVFIRKMYKLKFKKIFRLN
ncbi:MAG: glycosyltransferase family 2 protein [Burkholderiales bacterium]|nr:glycosyltransferase family 2 protein [Burkholderiales bacterium]